MEVKDLEPKELWQQFAAICAIPHPSKHEAAIIRYIKDFATAHHLSFKQDPTGNLLVCKAATAGKESSPKVILQAHVDMVPQKNSDKKFNFETDPIEPLVRGEWVTANGTTLGSDNGIGVASMLAILGSTTAVHPALECLFTIDEETGLTGANGLSSDFLSGELLINLDSEDEGELYVGCAGAVNNTVEMHYHEQSSPEDSLGYELSISGLKGGHSGIQIILQRGNANKLMTRFLRQQAVQNGLRLSNFDGGGLRNAIPREAKATVVIPTERKAAFEKAAKEFEAEIIFENSFQEDGIKFTAKPCTTPSILLDIESQKAIIGALTASPNGVFRMSDSMPGLVETSTNLSRVAISDGKLEVLYMTRCMVNYGKVELCAMIRSVWELAGARVKDEGDYNGWAPKMDSVLLATMSNSYKSLFGHTPEVKAIHAGLECGIIGALYTGMDMISVGPTLQYPHSPDERVDIASVAKFYKFLLFTLSKL